MLVEFSCLVLIFVEADFSIMWGRVCENKPPLLSQVMAACSVIFPVHSRKVQRTKAAIFDCQLTFP